MARVDVPPRISYRILNHGPATLVTTTTNIMAAQWVMPIDFDPPRVAIVVDRTTHTRTLFDQTGELALSIPTREQAKLVWHVGSTTGAQLDKLSAIETFPATIVKAPLVAGCIGWLECRVVRSPTFDAFAQETDTFVVEVVAAQADARCWRDDKLVLDELHTLHHLGGGRFVASGEEVSGR